MGDYVRQTLRSLLRMAHWGRPGITLRARSHRRKDEERSTDRDGGCRRDARDTFNSGGRVRAKAHGGTIL